ncbi:unnamed protein product [Durusdinium trenchii]|uniref:Uncharacterized protein n=1 Tax=Durusdinium trenchii TaxID=1381693 RepID=A0ABP0HAY0_9DINO
MAAYDNTTTSTTSTTNHDTDASSGPYPFDDGKPMMVTRHGTCEEAIAHAQVHRHGINSIKADDKTQSKKNIVWPGLAKKIATGASAYYPSKVVTAVTKAIVGSWNASEERADTSITKDIETYLVEIPETFEDKEEKNVMMEKKKPPDKRETKPGKIPAKKTIKKKDDVSQAPGEEEKIGGPGEEQKKMVASTMTPRTQAMEAEGKPIPPMSLARPNKRPNLRAELSAPLLNATFPEDIMDLIRMMADEKRRKIEEPRRSRVAKRKASEGDGEQGNFYALEIEVTEEESVFLMRHPRKASGQGESKEPEGSGSLLGDQPTQGSDRFALMASLPDGSADVGLLLSEVPYATVDTLLRTNKLVREVRMVPQTLVFPHWNVPWHDLSIVVWSDASNSNRPDKSSTMGIVGGCAPKSILDGTSQQVALITWRRNMRKRQLQEEMTKQFVNQAYDSVASHGLVHRLDRDTPGASKRLDRGVKSAMRDFVTPEGGYDVDRGYPLVGDVTYGGSEPTWPCPWMPRIFLHAARLVQHLETSVIVSTTTPASDWHRCSFVKMFEPEYAQRHAMAAVVLAGCRALCPGLTLLDALNTLRPPGLKWSCLSQRQSQLAQCRAEKSSAHQKKVLATVLRSQKLLRARSSDLQARRLAVVLVERSSFRSYEGLMDAHGFGAAVNLRNSKSLRLAMSRSTQASPALMAKARALLERLAAAESAAFEDLRAAERNDDQEPPVPWRLVCLDFDRTIAKEHMWGTYKEAPLEDIPVSEETFTDLALFRWLVRAVRKRAGEVAIATFGRADVAGKAMKFALGEDHGVVITTPADFPDPAPDEVNGEVVHCPEGSSWLGDKNTQLASLARRFKVAATDMILFDDDLHNVEEAAKAGVAAFHAPAGLNKAAVQKVAELIGLTGQSD